MIRLPLSLSLTLLLAVPVLAVPRDELVGAVGRAREAMSALATAEDGVSRLRAAAAFSDALCLKRADGTYPDQVAEVRRGLLGNTLRWRVRVPAGEEATIALPLPVQSIRLGLEKKLLGPGLKVATSALEGTSLDKGERITGSPAREHSRDEVKAGVVLFQGSTARFPELRVKATKEGFAFRGGAVLVDVEFVMPLPAESVPTRFSFESPDVQVGALFVSGSPHSAIQALVSVLIDENLSAQARAEYRAKLEQIAAAFDQGATVRAAELQALDVTSIKQQLLRWNHVRVHESEHGRFAVPGLHQNHEVASFLASLTLIDEFAPIVGKMKPILETIEKKYLDIEVEFDTTQEEKNQRIQALAEETARAIEAL